VAARFVQVWTPPRNGQIDFTGTETNPGPELVIRNLCRDFRVMQLAYDPYQLVSMAQNLTRDSVVWCKAFSQTHDRLEADKQLLDSIVQKRLAQDGNPQLRAHVDNANRKPDPETRKLRLVKRSQGQKIDLAVCLSMANYECLRLNL
jgi:phage terminase large subunit-like protein